MENKPVADLNWLCNWLEENSSGIYRPAKEAAHVIRSMSSEIESLRAQLKAKDAALEAIAFATAPNPDDGSHHENAYVLATEAMVAPIPVQQSPAVVVPDDHMHVSEFIDLCKSFSSRTGSIYIGDVESALSGILSADRPLQSPRMRI